MGHDSRTDLLIVKHAELDHLIELEENRPMPDQVIVHSLKKEKLKVKDEIRRKPS